MTARQYAFFPGCSSRPGSTAAHYRRSVDTLCDALGIQLNEVPDWNCCSASVGHVGGELPRLALSARNLALSERAHPGQDLVTGCAGCWLATREARERLRADPRLLQDTNAALGAARLKVEASQPVRHLVEVLVEDLGYEALAAPVKRPLEGIRVAGYVGCQTNRPFGVAGEPSEAPEWLDRIVAALGGDPVPDYEARVQCCGGPQGVSEPDKCEVLVRDIVEAAADAGAHLIVTPCPLCQTNVELLQERINARHGERLRMPVVYYSTLMAVAYGASAREAGLDGQLIPATPLEALAPDR
jgi:heterodisulfide reductase subunit B